MTDRHYTDDEVRRILALAADAEQAAGADAERPWTLAEIERIGAEAGLAPQSVAAAALALERQPAAPPDGGRYLGLPVSVSRAVPLARGLTDDDWEHLVAQLRDTFAAEGRIRVSGARREWRVGNLRVTHEPTGSGAVLQMRTRKGDARAVLGIGAGLLLLAAMVAVAVTAGPESASVDARRLAVAWMLGAIGTTLLLVGALRLPAWARQRARQFEALATYARRIAAS